MRVYLPNAVVELLKATAKRNDRTVSSVVRTILLDHYNRAMEKK